MQVVSVNDDNIFAPLLQVANAMSLEKLENEVQIHHLHVGRFHTVKRL